MRRTPIHILNTLALIGLAVGLAGSNSLAQDRVGVSPAQKEQLKALAIETRRKTEAQRNELVRARTDLLQVYRSYQLDERKARSAMERLGRAQLGLLQVNLDNQIQIRKILDAEQFRSFRQVVGRKLGAGMIFGRSPEEVAADRMFDRQLFESAGIGRGQVRRLWAGRVWDQRVRAAAKLRRDTKQLLDICSSYDLDEQAAKRLMASIHSSQTDLAEASHRQQQLIRSVLTPDEFQRLQAEIERRMRAKTQPRHLHPRSRRP